jgi:hypothetical protein
MARDENPGWARGETFYNGGGPVPGAGGYPINYQGREYLFEVNAPDGYTQNDTTGRQIRVKVAQNLSGAALLPGHIARYKAGTAPTECVVDGYWSVAGDFAAGVIDEFLPAAGVPNGDFFFLVIDGPTSVIGVASMTAVNPGDRLELAPAGASPTDPLAGVVNKFAAAPAVADLLAKVGRADATQSTGGQLFKAVVHFSAIR